MNNLPKKITAFDGHGEYTLELPQCVYCEQYAKKNNPVVEDNDEMVCFDCKTDQVYNKYFPKVQSPEAKIHEQLIDF